MAKGVGVAGAAIGAAAAVAGTAMTGLLSKTLEATSEINKFSQVTGMSTKGFQEWDHVAKQFGFSMEQASGDMAMLAERAMEAQSGIGENAEMFDKLGVSVTDASGKLKSQEQLFNEVIFGLQGMENATERNAIATAMLSTTGEELAPVLNMTNEELQKMKGNANVISEDNLAKADAFKLKWNEVKTTFSALVTDLGIKVMPVFLILFEWIEKIRSKITEWIEDNSPKLNSLKNTIVMVMNKAVEVMKSVWNFIVAYILPIFASLFSWVQGHMPVIKATISTVFNKIVEVAKMVWAFFKDNILPIIARFYEYIQSKMPQIRSIVESVFKIIANVVKIAWGIFENLLLPVLKTLWNWIKPHLPKIQSIVEGAFNAVITIVEGVVKAFEKVTSAIKTAYDWLTSWNNKPASKKTVEVEERRTSSSGRLGGVQRYATGTNYAPGGLAMVGERGPELVRLPRGSKVSTANETKDMLRNQQVNNTYITVQGNIDSDLYDEIMSKQDQNLNLKLGFAGVKG